MGTKPSKPRRSKSLPMASQMEIHNTCSPTAELAAAQDSTLPAPVREWLHETFCGSVSGLSKNRSLADLLEELDLKQGKKKESRKEKNKKIYGEETKKSLDKIVRYREPVAAYLEMLEDWSFDIFTVHEMSESHSLLVVGYETINRYDLINKYKMDKLTVLGFLAELERGYSQFDAKFHSSVHAADVTQTAHYLLAHLLQAWLSDLGKLAVLVACMGHDYPHTGTSNKFHTGIRSEIALVYNDKSVQENFHAYSLFRLLSMEKYNILTYLTAEEFRCFRRLVIEMILATDMASHFDCLRDMKQRLDKKGKIDKIKMLSMIIHCCDISHPSKPWEIHYRWTELAMDEYFSQGDIERNLGHKISPMCDRHDTVVSESQIAFIEYIVRPSFHLLGNLLEHILHTIRQKVVKGSKENLKVKRSSNFLGSMIKRSSSVFSSGSDIKTSRRSSRESKKSSSCCGSVAWNKLPLSQSHLRLVQQLDEIKKSDLTPWVLNLEKNEKNWKNCLSEGWPSEPMIPERPALIPSWIKSSTELKFETWGPYQPTNSLVKERIGDA